MTIRAGLRLMLAFIAALFLAVGLWMIKHTGQMEALTGELSGKLLPAVAASGNINTAAGDLRIAELMHIGSTGLAEKERYEAEMALAREKIESYRADYVAATVDNPAARQMLQSFSQTYDEYLKIGEKMLPLSRENRFDEAAGLALKSLHLFNSFGIELDRMTALAQDHAHHSAEKAEAIYVKGKALIFTGLAAVLTLCGLLLWGVERRLAQPIATVAAAATALSEGRLADATTPLTGRRDEVGALARAVEQAAGAVRTAAATLGGAAAAAAAGDLSARAATDTLRGDYAELGDAVNRLIAALSRPLSEVADVMRRVAAGDLEGRMIGVYEGDLRALKANLNRSLDTVVGLLEELGGTARAMADGNLAVRVDGAYRGSFADIKDNVNDGLDSLRAAMAVIYVNVGQVAAAAVETAAASNQVAALAADEAASRAAVRDVAELTKQAHLLALNAGVASARGGEGFFRIAADVADLAERAASAAKRLEGVGQRSDGADSAAAAAQIGAAMNDLALMVDEIKVEIQRFKLN